MTHLRLFIFEKIKLAPHLVFHKKNESHLSGITPLGSIQYKVYMYGKTYGSERKDHTYAHTHEIASTYEAMSRI